MSDLHDLLPPPGRVNGTWLYDLHPDDHNVVVDAVNTLADGSADLLTTIHLVVHANLAARLADTAQPDGTLSWTTAEGSLAVGQDSGFASVLLERMIEFDPRCWIGTDELTQVPVTDYVSRYRHEFGYCWFEVLARFGGLDGTSGVLSIMPPLPPTDVGAGPFQLAYAVVPTLGAIGGIGGAFNGTTTLAGASVDGQLAFVMPGTAGLMERGDMGPDPGTDTIDGGAAGEFDVSLAGFYPILGYVT